MSRARRSLLVALFLVFFCALLLGCAAQPNTSNVIRIGSLKDVEGNLLGELFAQTLEAEGFVVERALGLGGTGILLTALESGDVDIVPQYSSTIARDILARPDLLDTKAIAGVAAERGYRMSAPLGFNNTYGVGMQRTVAEANRLRTIDDLRGRPWRGGVSVEFAESEFGLAGMARAYELTLGPHKTMEHTLSYVALQAGDVDWVDVYTTDASIAHLELVVLSDTRQYFPRYEGVALAKAAFAQRQPRAWAALEQLAGQIDDATMIRKNGEVELQQQPIPDVVARWRRELVAGDSSPGPATATAPINTTARTRKFRELIALTWEHLLLVGASVGCALLLALPLGIWASRRAMVARWALGLSGAVQTIPGIALLCFFIPWFGIGWLPAWLALVAYALLPILQGLITGITSLSASVRDSCAALGMTRSQLLWRAELPLALPGLLAGLRIATVTTIGTASLAAWVGAGGYGTWIAKGLALNQWPLVLWGAVPSALMALLFHLVLGAFERRFLSA